MVRREPQLDDQGSRQLEHPEAHPEGEQQLRQMTRSYGPHGPQEPPVPRTETAIETAIAKLKNRTRIVTKVEEMTLAKRYAKPREA